MRYFELLIEARLAFSAADLAQAAAENEFGVVYLTMTGDGTLHLGDKWHARGNTADPDYHPDASARRSIKLMLWPATKLIDIRQGAAGENLKPKVQQALRSLRDGGIIDPSWTIRTSHEAAGYVDGKFTRFANPIDQKSLDDLTSKAIRLSSVTQDLILYHGTSSIDWQTIQRVGLHPLGRGTNVQHGSASRAKHAGNDRVLYLAGTLDKAQDYAKDRVQDWNRRRHGSEHIHSDDNDPVVLAVQIPDPARLVADDDLINRVGREIARKLWKSKPAAERKQIATELGQQHGFDPSDDVAQMLWRETDAGFADIFAKIPPTLFRAWKASLTRENQVGYRGIIPPKFLRRVL